MQVTFAIIEEKEKPSYIRTLMEMYIPQGTYALTDGCLDRPVDVHHMEILQNTQVFLIDYDFLRSEGEYGLNVMQIDNHIRLFQEKRFIFFSNVEGENFQQFPGLNGYRNTMFINVALSEKNAEPAMNILRSIATKGLSFPHDNKKLGHGCGEVKKKRGKDKPYKGFKKTVKYVEKLYRKEKWGLLSCLYKKRMSKAELYQIAAMLHGCPKCRDMCAVNEQSIL